MRASPSLLLVVLLASALGLPGPALAQSDIAVLAVDTGAAGPSAGDPLPAADAVRRELTKTGVVVLSADDTARRLRSLGLDRSAALSTYEGRLKAAEDAFAALDTERSLELLEETLADLAADADPTPEKQALLESARVRAAERLMALAGTSEQGDAATPQGQRALAHFIAALRVRRDFALSETEHPPKMHRLLAKAREVLATEGVGGLHVTSTPSGATVYVEGRPVGTTPLTLDDALPRGRHRVWVTLDDARSVTRALEVGATPAKLDVDLAFEGALWASGPGLRPVQGQTLNEAVASKVANLLGVDRLVLVGFASYDEARWLYGAVYATSERQTVRRGAVRLAAAAPSAADVEQLGTFLWGGAADVVDASAVPATVLPGEAGGVAAAGAPAGEGEGLGGVLLWTGVGVGAGTLALGAIGAAAVALIALSGDPPEPSGRFAVEVVR